MQESCILSDYEISMVASNHEPVLSRLSFVFSSLGIKDTVYGNQNTIYEVTKLYIVVIKTDMEV